MSVTRGEFNAAVKEAAKTGRPAPVKDSDGQVAYYVDRSGATVRTPASTGLPAYGESGGAQTSYGNTGPTKSSRPSSDFMPEQMGRTSGSKATPNPAVSAAQVKAETEAALEQANSGQGYVWVNGQRMRVTAVDKNGKPTALTYDQEDGSTASKPTQGSTVFNALNLSDIPNESAPFLMSVGQRMDANGKVVGAPLKTNQKGFFGAAGNVINAAVNAGNGGKGPAGKNMMTIGQGLEWFANLATSDSGAYTQMVDQLRKAGYAPSTTNDAIFNSDAAHAMALAMRDLSVVNSRPGGTEVTLSNFLNQGSQKNSADARAKAEAAYQPVNREMTDAGTLQDQAKQAAQAAIGRALTPAEEAAFEASFRGKENSMYDAVDASGRAQAGAQAAGESAAGATYTRPDASGEADAYLNSPQFAQQKAGVDVGKYAQTILKMVGLNG